MNAINTYGYMCIKHKNNIPLFIVQVNHELLSSFCVFNNSSDAQKYINTKVKALNNCIYNSDFVFYNNLVEDFKNSDALFTKMENKQIYSY